jgi:hypothetical protein
MLEVDFAHCAETTILNLLHYIHETISGETFRPLVAFLFSYLSQKRIRLQASALRSSLTSETDHEFDLRQDRFNHSCEKERGGPFCLIQNARLTVVNV